MRNDKLINEDQEDQEDQDESNREEVAYGSK